MCLLVLCVWWKSCCINKDDVQMECFSHTQQDVAAGVAIKKKYIYIFAYIHVFFFFFLKEVNVELVLD